MADQREVLAERMADEAVVGEEAAQVRVAREQDAEEVEGLALEPVGRGPDLDQGVDHRVGVIGAEGAQAQPPVMRDRQQVRHDGEPRAGRTRRRLGGDAARDTAREAGAGG